VLRDVSLRIAPITVYDAEAMINEIRAAKILEGYRGELPRDKKALTDIILKLSKLVEEVEEIKDVDLNPVMTYEVGRGAKIADARIIIR
jgi:acetyl-CoA synthetase (ADP-forming)